MLLASNPDYDVGMDINVMTLNVGNTRTAIGVFARGELVHTSRVAHGDKNAWLEAIRSGWKLLKDLESPAVTGASVNPAVAEGLEHVISKETGVEVEWLGREIDLPMKVLTDPPGDTGVDRIANIAAAYEQLGKACVVVDAGTAITIDACNDKGEFLGGAIAPGAGMQLAALHEKTAKLPAVELAVPSGVFGRTTRDAIRQGVYHGIRGLVKELAESYATELGSWPEVIATGGDAAVLFEGWEIVHAISPELTLYGIALAYTNHHIKHGD